MSKYNKVDEDQFTLINVGIGLDISIKDLTKLISKIIKLKVKMIFDISKHDETFRKIIDDIKLRKIK